MKNIILFLIIPIFLFSCSNKDDDNTEPYAAYESIDLDIVGTWKPVNVKTNASITFELNKSPYISISSSGKYYMGKPLYPKTGSDGSFYFKFSGNDYYSKLSYKRLNGSLYEFKLENSGVDFNEDFIKQ